MVEFASMGVQPRITSATGKVLLGVFLPDPSRQWYGLEIIKAAGIRSGTLYPVLGRLENLGWIEGEWEDIDPAVEGRRPRRYYTLTAAGLRAARQAQSAIAVSDLSSGLATS
jgi:DNA-binding MarR family transcriptional regulator